MPSRRSNFFVVFSFSSGSSGLFSALLFPFRLAQESLFCQRSICVENVLSIIMVTEKSRPHAKAEERHALTSLSPPPQDKAVGVPEETLLENQ